MPRRSSPTVRRRRLGAELRRLREDADLSGEEVIQHMDWSLSKLSRIETGRISVLWEAVAALLDHYGLREGEQREALIKLAREAKQQGWWQPYSDLLSRDYVTYIDLETAAESLRLYHASTVPGLLQTEAYAKAIIADAGALELDDTEVDRRVALRMERQSVLGDDGSLELWVILDEAALRRTIGSSEVMAAQLRRLAQVARRPGITIQLIPFEAGAHASLPGSFGIFSFDGGEKDVAFIESFAGTLYLERENEINAANLTYDHLIATAKNAAESLRLIKAAAQRLE
jgi:transcriptional regulator with XRE-family HTH domain